MIIKLTYNHFERVETRYISHNFIFSTYTVKQNTKCIKLTMTIIVIQILEISDDTLTNN